MRVREKREVDMISIEDERHQGMLMTRRVELGPLVYEYDRFAGSRRLFIERKRTREVDDDEC